MSDQAAKWYVLTGVDDVPPGSSQEFTVGGRIVALFNDAGQFHAIDGICAHQGGPLAKGKFKDGVVTCPWHGWQFQVANGNHCLNPRICQTSFEVRIEEGGVFVRV